MSSEKTAMIAGTDGKCIICHNDMTSHPGSEIIWQYDTRKTATPAKVQK
ncbi:hypothetical protein [uncultured Duncaniella sp.]|nr:hypothetical protein [uncultured Duncaniella sp.]